MKIEEVAVEKLRLALATARPELLVAFECHVEEMLRENHEGAASLVPHLLTAIGNLFAEVGDLRRTVDAMGEVSFYIERSLRGISSHVESQKAIHHLGRSGQLPDGSCLTQLVSDVKQRALPMEVDDD